jgi:hypothetical protein
MVELPGRPTELEMESSFSVRARASFRRRWRSRVLPVWLAAERILLVRVISPSSGGR